MFSEEPYLNYVTKQAQLQGNIFLLDSGEGNDFIDQKTGWYIEDLSGWLINPIDRERFLAAQDNETVDSYFAASYVFVKWSKDTDDGIQVIFKHY